MFSDFRDRAKTEIRRELRLSERFFSRQNFRGIKPAEFVLVSGAFWAFLGLENLPAQKAITAPMQPTASQVVLGLVEENATFSPNGNDRHYTEGLKLSFTSGRLGENS
jgi:hypothetical protein